MVAAISMEEFNIEKTVSYWLNSAKYDLSVAIAMFKSKKYPLKD